GLMLSNVAGIKPPKPDIVVATQVPDDAAVVVVAGPQERLADHALKALRDYMEPKGPDAAKKKKGKLVVLLDVNLTPDGTMVQTGLEPFLAEFGVKVGNNRVLHLSGKYTRNPTAIVATPNQDEMFRKQNPVAAPFFQLAFMLYEARTVDPQGSERPSQTRYKAEPLLVAPPDQLVWAETDLVGRLEDILTAVVQGKGREKVSDKPLS